MSTPRPKIGIVGHGVVGRATAFGFKKKLGITCIPYDLPENEVKWNKILRTDFVFVCVPTPVDTNFVQDPSAVFSVCKKLAADNYKGVVCIKSTILPLSIQNIAISHPNLKVLANPEFLTERTALQDVVNQKFIVIGRDENRLAEATALRNLYRKGWPSARIHLTSLMIAALMKCFTNCFFATKISLMNEFYQLCIELGIDWDQMAAALATDPRVGSWHLKVPGPDGDFGWGGKCFYKDLTAILGLMRKFSIISETLQGALDTNLQLRSCYNWLDIPGAVVHADEKDNNTG